MIRRRLLVCVVGVWVAIGVSGVAAAQTAAPTPAPKPAPQLNWGGGLSLTSGEESTVGYHTTVGLQHWVKPDTKFVFDFNKQFNKITRPTSEVVQDHFNAAAGIEFDVKRFSGSHALVISGRSEFDHDKHLGVTANFAETLGAGVRFTHAPTNLDLLVEVNLAFEDEKLTLHDHAEGWQTGYGVNLRASMNLSKKITFVERITDERQLRHPLSEFRSFGTVSVALTRKVAVSVEFDFVYASKLGPPHKKHYNESTLIGLTYRFLGS